MKLFSSFNTVFKQFYIMRFERYLDTDFSDFTLVYQGTQLIHLRI